MTTRNERVSDLLKAIGETFLNKWDGLTLDQAEEECPLFVKEINRILDEEFVSGYDYHADPTAPLLPGRKSQRAFYNPQRRGPGRPRKNPEIPPRPAGRHVTEQPDPDADQ